MQTSQNQQIQRQSIEKGKKFISCLINVVAFALLLPYKAKKDKME